MRQQRFADDGNARAAIVEDVLVVLGFRLRIDGHGHGADLDCAKKGVEELRRVQKQKENALLRANSESEQGIAGAVGFFQQLLISDTLVATFDSNLRTAALLDVAIHEVGRNIECFRQSDQEIGCLPLVSVESLDISYRKRARV